MDVYGSLSSVQPVNKCASSAILPPDYLSSSSTAFLGQAEAPKKKFPTALVVGGLIVGGVVLYYASRVGGTLAANPRAARKRKESSTEKIPLDVLAPALLSLKPVGDVTPLVRDSTVFVVETDRAQDATARMAAQIFGNSIVMDGSISYMGLVNTAKEQPSRPIVITDGQRMTSGTIEALGEIKSPVCVIGATSSETWGAPYDSLGRLNVLLEAARVTKATILVAVNGLWYSAKPKTLHDNPGRANNDSYSPFPVERIPGGRAAGMLPSDFDPVELARGAEHELEHTDDWRVAREIAMDHIAEDPAYYDHLDAMERGSFRDNPKQKLQWLGSGSGAWARGPNYKYYRLLQRAPGEWLVYFDEALVGAERTPALAKRLAQQHAAKAIGDYSVSFQTRRGSGQPGPWTVPDGDFATFEEAQDSARNTLARSTMFLNYRISKRRDNPSFKAGCVKDCHGTFGKNNKPLYLKKCLAACHGTLLGKGLADLPKGA